MDSSLKQYEIDIPGEFIIEAVEEIAEILNIEIDRRELGRALDLEDFYSEDNICIFYDKSDDKNFIMVDCSDTGLLNRILVRCRREICEKIKSKMLEIDTRLRKMVPYQTPRDDLENTISDPLSGFHYMVKKLKTKKIQAWIKRGRVS